jgi:hypothetical protein
MQMNVCMYVIIRFECYECIDQNMINFVANVTKEK